jgi:hypothetical protein
MTMKVEALRLHLSWYCTAKGKCMRSGYCINPIDFNSQVCPNLTASDVFIARNNELYVPEKKTSDNSEGPP